MPVYEYLEEYRNNSFFLANGKPDFYLILYLNINESKIDKLLYSVHETLLPTFVNQLLNHF